MTVGIPIKKMNDHEKSFPPNPLQPTFSCATFKEKHSEETTSTLQFKQIAN